jgi:very-short-patch-repair endonuclease
MLLYPLPFAEGEGEGWGGVLLDPQRRFARRLRNAATDAERRLWQGLRVRQVAGFRFNRQVPLGPYVVDFLCRKARLVVELDGSQHIERSAYDLSRTLALQAMGFRVIRFWNDDVLLHTEDVLAEIHRQLAKSLTPPQPSPSPSANGRG